MTGFAHGVTEFAHGVGQGILNGVQGHAAEQHEVVGLDAPRGGYGVVG